MGPYFQFSLHPIISNILNIRFLQTSTADLQQIATTLTKPNKLKTTPLLNLIYFLNFILKSKTFWKTNISIPSSLEPIYNKVSYEEY